ncbi:hypothetical protein [Nannocystis bainbridge]|uniref:Uncharacterized protein n=1 Tax=Nannocystis bainbridge TaxID=2995303 RepID=A0ABT5E8W6_9BACT|nr:hypothetical protein [Nannocystis bainbridge]MDC0722302.1 hypothetical protein [Nannocystis bainbridge]
MLPTRSITLSACLSLSLAACGDDGDASSSDTANITATLNPSGPGVSTTGVDEPTSTGTTGDPSGTMSDSESATEPATSTTADATGTGSTTEAATSDDTSATTDDTTTTDGTSSTTDDTTTGNDTTGGSDDCQAPATQPPCDEAGDDIFKAIGLNCSDNPAAAIPITNPVIMAPDTSSYRVATHFGTAKDPMDPNQWAWAPKEGSRFLVIGSGTFPNLEADGGLVEQNNQDSQGNGNPDNLMQLPGVMHHEVGSNNGAGGTPFMNCDGVHDCSDTIANQWNGIGAGVAHDVFYMSFDLQVPQGTHGYLLDFVYFTEEWPNFVGASVNDMLIVWSTSETFTGNVTFIDEQPLTVTALDPYMTILPGDPLLAGTGFPGDGEGAATGWYTAKGSAKPGESFTLAISVFDLGDTVWDTVGVIDKFRWDCAGCVPNEVDSCGVIPQ